MGLSRSEQMSRIRGRDTRPERALRSAAWARGLRHRLQVRLKGARPDLVYPGSKVTVFVDGCFWHGCPDHYVRPRSREAFWAQKLRSNVERDWRQTEELEKEGWQVLRFWEHEVLTDLETVVDEIEAVVRRRMDVRRRRMLRVIEVVPVRETERLEERRLVDLRSGEELVERRERTTRKW